VTRVAIVTGAAGALGSAISLVLRDAGTAVVGVDLTGDVELHEDVSTEQGTAAMVAAAVELHGRLDILVLNAGTQHVAPIDEFGTDAWDRLQALMCKGPFLAIRAAWPQLIAAGRGRIVAISSTNAIAAEPHKAAYNSAKAGVMGVIRTAALEGGAHGLTANGVAPGWMHTPQVENQLTELMRLEQLTRPQVLERMLSRMPVKRFVDPVEVAHVVRFLVSPEASAITGALVPVDLGLLAS
jgi:3-hydroxybutyrate dehydrogenase